MEFVKIVLMCVIGACVYGVVHDQITARICVEYFTVAHPRMIRSESPTLLGLFWGVFATWWMGAIAGILLGLCARLGRRHRMPARALRRPLVGALAVIALLAIVAGVAGRVMAEGHMRLVGWVAEQIPQDRHDEFLTVAWAHGASYAAGAVSVVGLSGWVVGRRGARGTAVRGSDDEGEVGIEAGGIEASSDGVGGSRPIC